jgi:hypothetical protein
MGTIMEDKDSTSSPILYPEWQHEYYAALVETASRKLLERVTAAETAIFKRLQTISASTDNQAERQAIEDALAGLRILKRENLGFPDWEVRFKPRSCDPGEPFVCCHDLRCGSLLLNFVDPALGE